MPTSKPRRGPREHGDKSRKGRLVVEKARSFHGRTSQAADEAASIRDQMQRPRTAPDLTMLRGGLSEMALTEIGQRPRLTKILLNVTISGSVGTVKVLMRQESTVGDLIAAALEEYIKSGQRPVLATVDPSSFDLHYSQFSLESLDKEEKLVELGSRNFFVCPKKPMMMALLGGDEGQGATVTSPAAMTCSRMAARSCFDWVGLMEYLL